MYFPVLHRLRREKNLDLRLIAAAGHLDPKYGNTVAEIEQDGFVIAARVLMTKTGDSGAAVAKAIGGGIQEFVAAYRQVRPDVVLLLGDRYEMFAAAIAALPMRLPLAHIHGGELTLGAIDDSIRHSITKLSHIHFVATAEYARRILQLGEEPWRVHTTGSPVIDSILSMELLPKDQLELEIGLDLSRTLLITYHPPTLESDQERALSNLLTALAASGHSLLFTGSNADARSGEIIEKIQEFVKKRANARFIPNLGHRKYHSIQKYVPAMVGNSSSGIIEAASFRLPVVNIGTRQAGRLRATNVIDVGTSETEIAKGIAQATSPEFGKSIAQLENPYGDGNASERIVTLLSSIEVDEKLLLKKFVDYPLN